MPNQRIQAATGGSSVLPKNFDIILQTDGNNKVITLLPGTVNEYVPVDMFKKFIYVDTQDYYIIVKATSNGREVTGATLRTSTTGPLPLGVKKAVAPLTFEILIGIVAKGIAYKTWSGGNILAQIKEAVKVDRPAPVPGFSVFERYYTWDITVGP